MLECFSQAGFLVNWKAEPHVGRVAVGGLVLGEAVRAEHHSGLEFLRLVPVQGRWLWVHGAIGLKHRTQLHWKPGFQPRTQDGFNPVPDVKGVLEQQIPRTGCIWALSLLSLLCVTGLFPNGLGVLERVERGEHKSLIDDAGDRRQLGWAAGEDLLDEHGPIVAGTELSAAADLRTVE